MKKLFAISGTKKTADGYYHVQREVLMAEDERQAKMFGYSMGWKDVRAVRVKPRR